MAQYLLEKKSGKNNLLSSIKPLVIGPVSPRTGPLIFKLKISFQ